jgi:hypothetical protein
MRALPLVLFTLFLAHAHGQNNPLPQTDLAQNPASESKPKTVQTIRLLLPERAGAVADNIGKVFARQIQQRCDAKVVTQEGAPLTVEFALAEGIGADGYRIEDRPGGGVRIVGSEERALLYGVGKFLRSSRYDQGGFTPGAWRGQSVPQKPVRGIYFAVHFHNFYHDAPVEEVEQYVEELGLWGFNTLGFWYDMRHAGEGFNAPEATALRARLERIGMAAKRVGMDTALLVIANESYPSAPKELWAKGGTRGDNCPWNICPSVPGGMDYLLKVLGEEFDWASAMRPAYVISWPYDSGGCGCADCRPWGSNGFLKSSERIAMLARQKLPGAKFVLSTWLFDKAELKGFDEALAGKQPWFDYVMSEGGAPRPMPGGVPQIGFPEISMHNTFPWGGFGATPLTWFSQGRWNQAKKTVQGGFPYSEGKFEDITKAAFSQFYWDDRPAAETVREYIAFEFSPEVVEDVAQVIATLEKNHHMRWWPGELAGVKLLHNWFPSRGAKPQADPGAEEAYATVKRVDAKLTPQARQSWRWRQLYLRALLDAELKANGGAPNDECNNAFAELIKMYSAENANPTVRPPLPADYQKAQ